tara:strand:- start:5623 stop:6327 length:705 start_codon:yes stop_codon:yes gene_type:complete
MRDRRQISQRGLPNQSGLEIFSSIITFGGEFLSWAKVFSSATLSGATSYETSTSDPTLYAVNNSRPTTPETWYLYFTTGLSAPSVPSVTDENARNSIQLTGNDSGNIGLYQQLSGLTVGTTYKFSVFFHKGSASGTITLEQFAYAGESDYSRILISETTVPAYECVLEFTAYSSNDVILIDFQCASGVTGAVDITQMSIKEKEEYLVPVVMTDSTGTAHNVLQRNLQDNLSDEE